MKKIEFSAFNKPKYFPQWLCFGDTLKLAEYDDTHLEELEKNIRDMSGQFDIDNARGAELDRIGKILGEERNGNTDTVYRIYLKLRTMLNTADGTVEDIIRFVKFFFSSETVHLIPNYPAGLRILHDGFNETMDFNSILKQIIGAGIAYDTREFFNITEDFPIGEEYERHAYCNTFAKMPFARNSLFRNGRVLRDGVTDFHSVPLLRDSYVLRNGTIESRSGDYRIPAEEQIYTPIIRNHGIIDLLAICFKRLFEDSWHSYLKRNSSVSRDGSEYRNGFASSFVNDSLSLDCIGSHITDSFDISETDEKKVVLTSVDSIGRGYKRNGTIHRGNTTYRASDRINDPFSMHTTCSEVFSEKWTATDSFNVGKRYWYYRAGYYNRNNSITRKSGVLEAL